MSTNTLVVTGIGFREIKKKYPRTEESTLVKIEGTIYKINPSVATVILFAQKGNTVFVVSTCTKSMLLLQKLNLGTNLHIYNYCLIENKEPAQFIKKLQSLARGSINIFHYGSATNVKNKKISNIFLDPRETPGEVAGEIIHNNIAPFYSLLQNMRGLINDQDITKVLILSSLASLRVGKKFGLDAIQKGAVHAMARSLALDLTQEGVYITEIMPGTTDSGYYDSPEVVSSKVERGKAFGYTYDPEDLPLLAPMRIAETVLFVIDTPAHFREISLIPYGQHPHLGA